MAARQHGVVSWPQLAALGLSRNAVHQRAKAGRLHRVHRGVYAVGHARLTLRGRWMAAVLACGPQAVLSHRSALALHDLRPVPAGPIDVTVPARGRKGPPGLRLHCVRALDPRDRTRKDAIPVTTVARALLDYADTARPQQLRLALEAAERRDALDGRALAALLHRSPGRRGLKALSAALRELGDEAPWTRSELENHVLALVRHYGLPEPQCNVVVDGFTVDAYWPEANLVLEADSWHFHKTRAQFEEDRRRDAELQARGKRAIRVTQRRLTREGAAVATLILGLLERSPPA